MTIVSQFNDFFNIKIKFSRCVVLFFNLRKIFINNDSTKKLEKNHSLKKKRLIIITIFKHNVI